MQAATQSSAPPAKSVADVLLAAGDLGNVYVEDGAADGTVMQIGRYGQVEKPHPAVASIVALGAKSIPLLIDCLDDVRLTSATFKGGFTREKLLRVPVGYVCLDILTNVIESNSVFIKNCADDGLGACINGKYYFRPDDYYPTGEDYTPRLAVSVAKANWSKAYKDKRIRFQFPSWWKRRI